MSLDEKGIIPEGKLPKTQPSWTEVFAALDAAELSVYFMMDREQGLSQERDI